MVRAAVGGGGAPGALAHVYLLSTVPAGVAPRRGGPVPRSQAGWTVQEGSLTGLAGRFIHSQSPSQQPHVGVALGHWDSNYTPSLLSWGCQCYTSSSATPMACFPSSPHPVGGEKGRPPWGTEGLPLAAWPQRREEAGLCGGSHRRERAGRAGCFLSPLPFQQLTRPLEPWR